MNTKEKKPAPNKKRRREARKETREASANEIRAVAKYVKTPPQKVRYVMDNIRGKSAQEALDILKFTNRRAARILEKVVTSAVANAENNHNMDSDNLYIHRAFVDGGPMMKRFMARAMGRACPIRKRTSHITIVLKEKGEEK